MAQKKKTIKVKKSPRKREENYVTQAMHERLREELKYEISSVSLNVKALEKKMDSKFKGVEARFKDVDARFNEVDARFDKMDARFDKMESRFEGMEFMFTKVSADMQKMNANVQRTLSLMEEQRAENKTIWDKQAQLEHRIERIEK